MAVYHCSPPRRCYLRISSLQEPEVTFLRHFQVSSSQLVRWNYSYRGGTTRTGSYYMQKNQHKTTFTRYTTTRIVPPYMILCSIGSTRHCPEETRGSSNTTLTDASASKLTQLMALRSCALRAFCRLLQYFLQVMLHQPSGGANGMAADIAIVAEEIIKTRARLNELYAQHTEQVSGRFFSHLLYSHFW